MSDDIKTYSYEWSEAPGATGVTAETIDSIDITTIDLSSLNTQSVTLNTSSGMNGTWGSLVGGSGTITLTDPYEELRERLEKLEAIIAEEKKIRDECPAVRNAYDEYRFLLVLAQRNKGDLLTDNS